MLQTGPAAFAFAAFGANLLTGALLLLFNARNRGIRWYVLFVAGICAWLLSQGVLYATAANGTAWNVVHDIAVMLLPGLFLAAALCERFPRASVAALVVSVLLLPFLLPGLLGRAPNTTTSVLIWLCQIIGWGGGSVLHFSADWRRDEKRSPRSLIGIFLVIVPLSIVGAQLIGSDEFFVWVMPPLTIVIQFMIFVGVTRLRFYDIEVRASRTGEIATRAAETERLAVLGELAATVAHEVRNPLTGMRSLAQRIANDEVEPVRRVQYANVILEEIDRVERMVSNLLDIARRSPVHGATAVDIELDSLFGDLALLVAAQARSANVTVKVRGHGVRLLVAREPLAQAILNLVINALAHSPAGGTVLLSAWRTKDGVVEIGVRDNGPGVPLADRDRIFEPFHTTRANGSGLGLTVVRRLASELGWRVDVRAALDGGAEFVLRIHDTSAEAVTA